MIEAQYILGGAAYLALGSVAFYFWRKEMSAEAKLLKFQDSTITALKQQVSGLTADNASLTTANAALTVSNSAKDTTISGLQNQVNTLSDEVAQLKTAPLKDADDLAEEGVIEQENDLDANGDPIVTAPPAGTDAARTIPASSASAQTS